MRYTLTVTRHLTLDIQKRLKALKFDPGPLDGAPGPRTNSAIRAFQQSKGLAVDGIVGPKTIAALFGEGATATPLARYPWLDIAIRKKGLHESADYAELSRFLRSDGKTLGDPRKLPWCGDFVETCIALGIPGEPLPTNPYLARNWLKFGKTIRPTLGAVMVFWRGSKTGTSGHVAFAVGEDGAYYMVIGGNQSNSVSVAKLSKSRLLGARWPVGVPVPVIHLPKASGGVVSVNEA
jgi:uncharacterized protein (TIGR02594 family)